MERTISEEEKIRHAIEIAQKRNRGVYSNEITRVNVNEQKNYKLFKKMLVQIMICLMIYVFFYFLHTSNLFLSKEVIESTQHILNYDINLEEWYQKGYFFFKQFLKEEINEEKKEEVSQSNLQPEPTKELIQNTAETTLPEVIEQEVKIEPTETKQEMIAQVNHNEEKIAEKTQMEKDAEVVKKICKFQKPLSGKITSEFGDREVTLKGMTSNHKGIDIANNQGTMIKAAMAGTVSVAEENSEYGKFIKITNGDVMTVYAHCSTLKVKKGDKIKIGQTIARVGSTGVSTGPHLHFEIRYQNRYINPKLVINF